MKFFLLFTLSGFLNLLCFGQDTSYNLLIKQLDTIYKDDQVYRNQLETIRKKYANDSLQLKSKMNAMSQLMLEKDSINQAKVAAILDKYGWLGIDVIGSNGSAALFLVIQHANLAIQLKYLPMMREAVKNGNALGSDLALLEDRVAIREGKKQIYGSQLAWNMIKNEYIVLPLLDPDNVDKRRAEMGLPSLGIYLDYFGLKWDAEQYKKDLPAIEAWVKTKLH